MKTYNPFYQLEVKFTPIIDFKYINRKIIKPYLRLATRIGVKNENTLNESLHIISDDEKFVIYFWWDRLFLVSQGGIEDMTVNNSIVEQFFFPLLNDITASQEFLEIQNYLLFITTISMDDDKNNNEKTVSENFTNKYLSKKTKGIFENISDAAIMITEKTIDNEVDILCGPYLGGEDLGKRKSKPQFEITDFDVEQRGQISEIKIVEFSKTFDFEKFKNLVEKYKYYYDRLQ